MESSKDTMRVCLLTKFQLTPQATLIFLSGSLRNAKELMRCNSKDLIYSFNVSTLVQGKAFSWNILRTYREFAELQCVVQATKPKHSSPPRLISWGKIKKLPIDAQLACISKFINDLASDPNFMMCAGLHEFLEVSLVSFEGVKRKLKEGYVTKRTGGRTANERHFCNITKYFRRYQRRWLVIRENLVGYLTNNTSENLHEALLYKGKFMVLSGHRNTGFIDGVKIITAQREFVFRAGSVFRRMLWTHAINEAYNQSDWKQSSHSFGSSFPVRTSNLATWYVDGEGYFKEVYAGLLQARSTIYISDWWLSPEFYLMRPAEAFPASQVMTVLGKMAEKGVKVYVTLYKEVEMALTLSSLHSKSVLESMHPNIKVLRHPQRCLVGGEFLWSHHEKIVVIDQEVAFIGGLDMCYGRMDNPKHLLVDNGPSPYWVGIDYSNSRIADFTDVQRWSRDSIDRNTVPRMPWHDIALKVSGRAAVDVGLHFIELWNHISLDITGSYHKNKKVLVPSLDIEPSEIEIPLEKPEPERAVKAFKQFQVGTSKNIDLTALASSVYKGVTEDHALPAQLLRASSQNPAETKEKQLQANLGQSNPFIMMTSLADGLGKSLAPTDSRAALTEERQRREMEEEAKEEEERKQRAAEDEDTLPESMLIPSLHNRLSKVGSCRCQVLRSAGTWSLGLDEPEMSIHSAYLELIDKAKNFIYIENQFFISSTAGDTVKNSIAQALVERIKVAAKRHEQFKVIVVMPLLPAFEGSIDDDKAAVLRVQLFWEYNTICRGSSSLYSQLSAANIDSPEQYISFYGLRTHAELLGVPVTELIYVHSKLMIVDDDFVILGSANINDRSMLGRNDSEIAVTAI
jgi:phospholipase D1/2